MKALIILADGFETIEALGTVDLLFRAGIESVLISAHDGLTVTSAQGVMVACDRRLTSDLSLEDCRLVVLPGGMGSTERLIEHHEIPQFLEKVLANDIYLAAICAAPLVLASHQMLVDCHFTSYPSVRERILPLTVNSTYVDETVVVHDKLITSQGPFTTFDFAYKLIELLVSQEKTLQIQTDLLDNR